MLLIIIYNLSPCLASDNYWQNLFKTAFSNNPKVKEIEKNYISSYIYKKQNDYLWFPYFQLDLHQNIEETRGDYLYLQNQYSNNQNMWIFNPLINFSINQKLPGNGNINLSLEEQNYIQLCRKANSFINEKCEIEKYIFWS